MQSRSLLTAAMLLLLVPALGMAEAPLDEDVDAAGHLDELDLPPGFHIEIYAKVPGARQMALGQSTGTVFVGTRGSKVYAVVDKDKDRKADRVVPMLEDLNSGNGVATHQGFLYVAERHRITRYPVPGLDLDISFADLREVIHDRLPDESHHGTRYLAFGPDGRLYVAAGVPCNICRPKGIEDAIVSMNPDGSDVRVFARGIRNSVGMAFQPGTGHLYFTDNGVDMMGDDVPPGELNRATKAGQHFGFPFFAGGRARQEEWADAKPPEDVAFPVVEFQAHTANLGLKFYTGGMFPADYRGDLIVAQHGSWNRSTPVGYRLMRVRFDDRDRAIGKEVFVDGWLRQGEAWGRPADVLQLPDGSLLVSDDFTDFIYRISYGEEGGATGGRDATQSDRGWDAVEGLVMPESVVAHPDGRVFVSEIGEFDVDGDGKITVIERDGTRHTLVDGLDDPKGMDLWNDALYVTDKTRVLEVTLDGETRELAGAGDFPGTPQFLNDVEIDGAGHVYVSDSGTREGTHSGIYRITRAGEVSAVAGEDGAIQRPNGLLMDGVGRMLVVDAGTGTLHRLDLASGATSALNEGFGHGDGLVRDSLGYLYVSDWAGGRVWQLTEPRATPQLIGDAYETAADITLARDGRHLLVPDMKAGRLHALPIR